MIQKIMPKVINPKPLNRTLLKATTVTGLVALAGSSMSNWSGPRFEPTEMVIPGGLDFKEKAFYLLTHKMPKSVYERWVPNNSDYVPQAGDQTITVSMAEGKYIGGIIKGPEGIDIGEIAPISDGNIGDAISDSSDVLPTSDSDLSEFDIWLHLAGMQ